MVGLAKIPLSPEPQMKVGRKNGRGRTDSVMALVHTRIMRVIVEVVHKSFDQEQIS